MRAALAASLLALMSAMPAVAGDGADPVVVELFTSQGCSSCPPADDILGDLAGRDGVIALSLHVDYWDWIGWEDTFGSAAHSDRQRRYAAAVGSNMIYTPQFVIAGTDHVAGAQAMDVADAVMAHKEAARDVLGVADGRLTLAGIDGPARLHVAYLMPKATVAIGRGENAGRAVSYHNIVADLVDLGEWDGVSGTLDLPPPREGLARVAFAQAVGPDGFPGPIVGAARID